MCGTAANCAQGATVDAYTFALGEYVPSGPDTDLGSNVNPTQNEWHYVVGTYDGSIQKIYVDGVLNQQMVRSGNIIATSQALTIGANLEQAGRNWDGMLDEIRVSNSARNLSWIKAEYYNQNSPNTFMSFGPEQQID